MTEIFTQDVLIDGTQDEKQLRVQGHSTQNQPLQTWENSAADVLGQVTGDGRFVLGDDLGAATPDSMVEAHRDSTSTSKPKRGFHSLGRIADTLNTVVAWAAAELELLGAAGISALHSALRVKLTNQNNGTMTGGADLRAGDFEVVNGGGSSPVAKLTAVQAVVTNNSGAAATDVIGLKVTINNSGTITNPYAIHTDPGGIVHLGDTLELQRPAAVPGTPATDLIRVYPKSDGKLYAKNWSGVESPLTVLHKQVEIDFGTLGTPSKVFTISDSDITVLSKIMALQSGEAATGRAQDENEMDALHLRCAAGVGEFTVFANSLFGPVAGKYKINYSIA